MFRVKKSYISMRIKLLTFKSWEIVQHWGLIWADDSMASCSFADLALLAAVPSSCSVAVTWARVGDTILEMMSLSIS